jgi:hypothetical protein
MQIILEIFSNAPKVQNSYSPAVNESRRDEGTLGKLMP